MAGLVIENGDLLVGELLGILNVIQAVGIGVVIWILTKRNE